MFYFCFVFKNEQKSKRDLVIACSVRGDETLINRNTDFILDNLPIHSAKCSCSEYDGVLLLIIIITVMVIINNYLMM